MQLRDKDCACQQRKGENTTDNPSTSSKISLEHKLSDCPRASIPKDSAEISLLGDRCSRLDLHHTRRPGVQPRFTAGRAPSWIRQRRRALQVKKCLSLPALNLNSPVGYSRGGGRRNHG